MAYVTKNRVLIEAAKRISQEQGLSYEEFSDGWVVRLRKSANGGEAADKIAYIFGYYIDCNAQAASMIASDKVATYSLLVDAKLAVVPHFLLRSHIMSDLDSQLLHKLFAEHHDMVIKPLKGMRGIDVVRYDDPEAAEAYIRASSEKSWAISPYIDIRREIRIVVFRGEAMIAYEKTGPQVINGLAMYNLEHGAQPQDIELAVLPEDWQLLACGAMEAIGLAFGAVDIVIDADGKVRVLEINSGFSLEHYAQSAAHRRQQALDVYLRVFGSMFA